VSYDRDELKELSEAFDLELFLDAEGIRYKRGMGSRGPQLNLQTCPFCGGNKWKVFVNAENGLGNCFHGSCEKTFNKIGFVRAVLGGEEVRFGVAIEHMRRLAQQNGWRARRTIASDVKVEKGSPKLPLHHRIPINGMNLGYLANRGIDVATARYFDLRYCHEGQFAYKLEDGMWGFQNFRRRVLIPVYDLDGVLVSFQGRDITGQQEPKYLFPIGYAVTGSHLYNGHNVTGTTRIAIGEGAFDVAAIKLAFDADPDLRDVVAVGTFGKHLSFGEPGSQLEKFRRLKDEQGITDATFVWDGEIQATDDAIDAAKLLRGIGFKVRIAMLPPEKDPNEVPAEVVRRAFYEAIPYTDVAALDIKMRRRRMNAAAKAA
jgi:DNA primase